MFNLGGGEILVILLVALIVLGPTKLPEAARKMGQTLNEFKRISKGFQDEFQAAMDEPIEAEARAAGERSAAERAAADRQTGSGTDDPRLSTAAAAGMYDVDAAETDDAGGSSPDAAAPPDAPGEDATSG